MCCRLDSSAFNMLLCLEQELHEVGSSLLPMFQDVWKALQVFAILVRNFLISKRSNFRTQCAWTLTLEAITIAGWIWSVYKEITGVN